MKDEKNMAQRVTTSYGGGATGQQGRIGMAGVTDLAGLAGLYRDLHAHPELAFQESRTAGIVAGRLRNLGYETTTGIGGTGVVAVLRNGAGPIALLRADMDALPVQEQSGLDYASSDRGTDHGHGRERCSWSSSPPKKPVRAPRP
jgi:hypothetical protein